MSDRVTIKVEGLDRILHLLDNLNPSVARIAEARMNSVLERMRDKAKADAPVGTPESTGVRGYVGGSLKKSVRIGRVKKLRDDIYKGQVSAGGYIVNPNTGKIVDYASFQEYGTSKISARRFMRNARDKFEHEAEQALLDSVSEAIEKGGSSWSA